MDGRSRGYSKSLLPPGPRRGGMRPSLRALNELVMFRAPLGELLNRRAYEHFGVRTGNGEARWVCSPVKREGWAELGPAGCGCQGPARRLTRSNSGGR